VRNSLELLSLSRVLSAADGSILDVNDTALAASHLASLKFLTEDLFQSTTVTGPDHQRWASTCSPSPSLLIDPQFSRAFC
jgi:hypothetical protein